MHTKGVLIILLVVFQLINTKADYYEQFEESFGVARCLCTDLSSTPQIDLTTPDFLNYPPYSTFKSTGYYFWIAGTDPIDPDIPPYFPNLEPSKLNTAYQTQYNLVILEAAAAQMTYLAGTGAVSRNNFYRVNIVQGPADSASFALTFQTLALFFAGVPVYPVVTLVSYPQPGIPAFSPYLSTIEAQGITQTDGDCFIVRNVGTSSGGIAQGIRIANEIFTSPICGNTVSSNVTVQTTTALENMEALTNLEGMNRNTWTSVHLHVGTNVSVPLAQAAYAAFMVGYNKPPLTVFVNGTFPNAACLVMVEVTAHKDPCGLTQNIYYNINEVYSEPSLYSNGVQIGDKIIAVAYGTNLPGAFVPPYSTAVTLNNIYPAGVNYTNNFDSQYRTTIKNIKHIIARKGATFADLVYGYNVYTNLNVQYYIQINDFMTLYNGSIHYPYEKFDIPTTGSRFYDSQGNPALFSHEATAFVGSGLRTPWPTQILWENYATDLEEYLGLPPGSIEPQDWCVDSTNPSCPNKDTFRVVGQLVD